MLNCAVLRVLVCRKPALCKEQAVKFQPMVCEATGAWSQEAGAILRNISQAAAARLEEDAGSLHTQLLQELSVIARAHRARAILRRRSEMRALTAVEPRLTQVLRLLLPVEGGSGDGVLTRAAVPGPVPSCPLQGRVAGLGVSGAGRVRWARLRVLPRPSCLGRHNGPADSPAWAHDGAGSRVGCHFQQYCAAG